MEKCIRFVAAWWKSLLLTLTLTLVIGELVARKIDREAEFITRREWQDATGGRLTSGEDLRGKTLRWIGQIGKKHEYEQDVFVNSFSFHDRNHEIVKPTGVQRILVVGDSFVEAFQVAMDDAMPRLLEKKLRGQGLNIEIISVGRSGWGSIEYRAAIEEWAPRLSIDAVVWCFFPGNDIRNASASGTRLAEEQRKSPLGDLWRRREDSELPGVFIPMSALNRLLARAAFTFAGRRAAERCDFPYKTPIDFYVFAEGTIPFVEEGWARTFDDLRAVKSFLASRRTSLVVVSLTDALRMAETDEASLETLRHDYPEARERRWDFGLPEARLAKFLESESIAYVNLQADFRERFRREHTPYHFLSDGHWNGRGHMWAAEDLIEPVRISLQRR